MLVELRMKHVGPPVVLTAQNHLSQVCNAVYTRFNFTQPLCACADRFQGPCSASIARNDYHTIEVGMKKLNKVRFLN